MIIKTDNYSPSWEKLNLVPEGDVMLDPDENGELPAVSWSPPAECDRSHSFASSWLRSWVEGVYLQKTVISKLTLTISSKTKQTNENNNVKCHKTWGGEERKKDEKTYVYNFRINTIQKYNSELRSCSKPNSFHLFAKKNYSFPTASVVTKLAANKKHR